MSRELILVAPVAPYRGGIARHSTALASTFSRSTELSLSISSFHRLYPRILYPGDSDRDRALDDQHPAGCNFHLDTLNPLTWSVHGGPGNVAVIPAWTFVVAPMLGTIARRLRRQGITVVMIVHNAADHESASWKSRLLDWQLAAADGFIVHTAEMANELRRAGFTQPCSVVPHPAYVDFPQPLGTLARERRLELLCFGLVRRYKGVDIALRALASSGLEDVRLTIAGEVWEDKDSLRALCSSRELRDKIELIDRYVSDAEAAELFSRCDAVVAPYRAVTGSGVLALAQHYRRPVVASNLPGFAGLIAHGSTGWLFPAQNESALAALIRDEITRPAAAAMHDAIGPSVEDGGWASYADAVLELADLLHVASGSP